MDESKSHTNGDTISPIFSQTQTGINNFYAESDHEERQIIKSNDEPQFNKIAKLIDQNI